MRNEHPLYGGGSTSPLSRNLGEWIRVVWLGTEGLHDHLHLGPQELKERKAWVIVRGVFVGDRSCPVEETQEVTGVRVSENLTIAQILHYPQPRITGDPHWVLVKQKLGRWGRAFQEEGVTHYCMGGNSYHSERGWTTLEKMAAVKRGRLRQVMAKM